MISGTHPMEDRQETPANTLCKSCGLCCTGHLFVWAKLRPGELDSAEALGLTVFRSDPRQRGFSQPCPLWQGQCTIYDSPRYPHVCRTYRCKLLKTLMAEDTTLSHALVQVRRAKDLIGELEAILPHSANPNFRERLVAELEAQPEAELQQKAEILLDFYERVFGVDDLVENAEDGELWERKQG